MHARMKTKPLLKHVALFASALLPSSLHALDVHEWGTFTVLVSSRGQTVNWYQPYTDIAKLPAFVNMNPMMMKSSIQAARVRMETPVIYFYPEQEMNVSVRVAFAEGSITERFPATTDEPYLPPGQIAGLSSLAISHQIVACVVRQPTSEDIFANRINEFSAGKSPVIARWKGKLLAPDHADAKLIPPVVAQQGENYAAARNVPDAWIFHSDAPNKLMPTIPPVEKFIFYRGAGQSVPPYAVTMPDDQSVSFTCYGQSASTFQIALRVKDGKASWVKLPNISGPMDKATRSATVKFPEQTISLEQADQELRAQFLDGLTESGLTKAEAQAMINTWNHTWFAEPGQRVFTIVDRTWVDSVLPIAITPEPKKIERVFVARFEILSPAAEKQIAEIMTKKATDRKIADLQLGRFSNGAIELAAENLKQTFLNNFRTINAEQQAPAEAEK